MMMYGVDKNIWVDTVSGIICSPDELHHTYLNISDCLEIVAYLENLAEQYLQGALVTALCWWSCPPHPVLLICFPLDFILEGSAMEARMRVACSRKAWK